MKKRIFLQMVLLVFASILLVSAVLCVVFYSQFSSQVRIDLQERAQVFAGDDAINALPLLQRISPEDMRVTLIAPDGSILFDNMADPQSLENHLGREEVEEALSAGEGESIRYSETLGQDTYYYAVQLADGTVLRTAKTIKSIWNLFAGSLPVMVAAVAFFAAASYLAAGRLAGRVVAPLSGINPDEEPAAPYDELAPYVKTIASHREQLSENQAELKRRADTINAIMESMNEGVLLLDRQERIIMLNKSARRIFGTGSDMEGRNVRELYRDIDFIENIQHALSGTESEFSLEKAGKIYRMLISPVDEIGVVVLFLDTTEKSQADKMRQEFSANVSHELKTPLTSIYGLAEMLHGGVVKQSDHDSFYQKIMGEASRLIALIEDIIMLSALDEKGRLDKREALNLAALATECAESLQEKATAGGVTLSVSGAATLTASRPMLYELLYNLTDNGITYNKPGGSVTITLSEEKGEAKIAVADTGIGIPAEEQGRIFERFYRVDKSRSKKSGGTGLGLAIVKHIAQAHGGRIEVSSKAGEGTLFTVFIPLIPCAV